LKYQEHQNQMNNIINEYTLQSQKIKTDQEIQQQQHIAHLQELKQQSEYKAAEISTRAKLDEITLKTQSEIDKLKREIDIEKITFFLNNIHTYLQQLHQNHQIEKEKAQNEIEIDKIKNSYQLEKDMQQHIHEMKKIKETELTKAHIEQILTTLEKLSNSYNNTLHPNNKSHSYIDVINI
ncbi:MAG: hypothetical protein D6799_02485, partial [Bacteroidetes bacterium]